VRAGVAAAARPVARVGGGSRTQQTPSTEQVLGPQQTSSGAQGWPQISQVSMVGDSGAQ
jgi:hypothetical protein